MSARDEILAANRAYAAEFGDKAELSAPPSRHIAILTCMDARLEPYRFAGLVLGDAHVIRNAGGRASDDAIRSLAISHKLLGTTQWFVIHHSDCGMQSFTDEEMRDLFRKSRDTAELGESGWVDSGDTAGTEEADFIEWLTISDQPASVIADVRRLREHPLVSPKVAIYGFIFDVKTGNLEEVAEATEIGKPRA